MQALRCPSEQDERPALCAALMGRQSQCWRGRCRSWQSENDEVEQVKDGRKKGRPRADARSGRERPSRRGKGRRAELLMGPRRRQRSLTVLATHSPPVAHRGRYSRAYSTLEPCQQNPRAFNLQSPCGLDAASMHPHDRLVSHSAMRSARAFLAPCTVPCLHERRNTLCTCDKVREEVIRTNRGAWTRAASLPSPAPRALDGRAVPRHPLPIHTRRL